MEGELGAFRGEPKFEMRQIFTGGRLPNVVVATDGTVLAAWGWGQVRVRRSEDGGTTWGPEIAVGKGLLSGGVTVDEKTGDILLYSNADTPEHHRVRMTVWASFDGGKSWPVKRLVFAGPSAYSSLDAGRPGTPAEGWIYLLFESGGAKMARFNLSWLLESHRGAEGRTEVGCLYVWPLGLGAGDRKGPRTYFQF